MTIQTIASSKHYYPDAELARDLVAIYGSPLYVYDAWFLDESISTITNSVAYPRTRFAFAAVTNGNLALLRKFRGAGWGLHANTPGDAYLGLSAGFDASDIIYSGSNLTRQEMEQMLRWGVGTFNLDSISQLELLGETRSWLTDSGSFNFTKGPRIGFRLNLPSITGESRIGISPDELSTAEETARRYGVSATGIHFYRGTSTNATERFSECIDSVLDAGEKLTNWEYLDFGGGFGFAYFDRRQSFEWSEFGFAVTNALEERGVQLDLLIEPGRSVIAGAAALLCTVVATKWQGDKQIVGVDATTSNIAVLSVHGGTRQVRAYRESTDGKQFSSDVCGNTTYSRDYLSRSCLLPEMHAGDLLAILDAGAYGYAMSSHFLHRPKAAEVLVENRSHRVIRKRENLSCLLEHQTEVDANEVPKP